MILRLPTRIINAMKQELHRRGNMPPEMYAELKKIRKEYSSAEYDDRTARLAGEICGGRMYALLSSEVRELKLEVKHGKANFELGGDGWRPVLIADTEEELEAEIRRCELRPEALRHKVTEAISTLTD
jgi:CRISPR/Cas system-associated endonuclease Cas1